MMATMTLQRLVAAFEKVTELPIEIPDVRDMVVSFGIQDRIICVPEDSDAGKCRGVYYQFTTRDGVYADPNFISLIVYSQNLDKDWQRVICAKEMIHIMDAQAEKTRTEQEVQDLVDKLLGPMSTEDFGLADLMAAVDKLALYQSLIFLFPDAARDEARSQIAQKNRTPKQIAEWASLPLSLSDLVISDDWPELKKVLLNR